MAKYNQLTDTAIRKAKPANKVQKLTDGGGLRLEITKAGTKVFKYRFSLEGKDSDYVIGQYPLIKLTEARAERDKAKALVQKGINPNDFKKEQKSKEQEEQIQTARVTFSQLFEEWHKHNAESWTYGHAKDIRERIEKYLIPELGALPLEDIKAMSVIKALKVIEQKGRIETLRRIKQYANRIFKYGVGMGFCESNPVSELPDDIFKKAERSNYAHTTDEKTLTQILHSIDEYKGDVCTQKALELQPYVFLRSKELAGIRWDEIDLDNMVIEIPAERMKKKRAHLIPISSKVLEVIEYMKPISGQCDYLFPSPRTNARPIGEQTLNPALHRLGWKGIQTFHGFRHTASTMLNEMAFVGDIIEKQLAHEETNKVRGAYNKAQYIEQRKEMMQVWSNYLDGLKKGADIIPLKRLN